MNMASRVYIDENTSRLFNMLKVLSIFMVVTGHFFKEFELLWVPVTVGLLIFSFSSGYFTSMKYKGHFSKKEYWKKKANRLGIHLVIINSVLLILFTIQGRENIISWHSLVNMIGMNGFLNWFGINNTSPFGAGMWYFTLLLVFYACYPILQTMNGKLISGFTLCFIIGMFILDKSVYVGHALWLTACGFIIGVWAEKHHFTPPVNLSRITAVLIFLIMVLMNYKMGINSYNFLFILFFSIAAIYGCMDLKIPNQLNCVVLYFSSCLLEIYLLHPYLRPAVTSVKMINYVLSIVIVVVISKMASSVALALTHKLGKV